MTPDELIGDWKLRNGMKARVTALTLKTEGCVGYYEIPLPPSEHVQRFYHEWDSNGLSRNTHEFDLMSRRRGEEVW